MATKTHQVHERGASNNSGLPAQEPSPWLQNVECETIMRRTKLPQEYAIQVNRFRELDAQISWGAVDYEPGALEQATRELAALPIHADLGVNLHVLSLIVRAEDLVIRIIQGPQDRPILLFGIDGLLDTDRVEKNVVRPLVRSAFNEIEPAEPSPEEVIPWLQDFGLSAITIHSVSKLGDGVSTALQGDLFMIVDGFDKGAFVTLRGWRERALSESTTEPAIKAPKEAFNESIRTMTAQIRRRVKTPNLRIERYLVGTQSPTAVDLIYIQGITDPDLILEARARLTRVQIDSLTLGGELEELIEDQPSAIFSQFITTERPNRVAAALMEGQIAFLVDGFQNAKIAPASFTHFLPSPDDYEERFWYGTFVLWIRLIFLLFVIFVPSMYVSLVSIHPDMLPTRVLMSLAAARLGIAYPTIVEVLIMEFFFEGLREATSLLPRTVGGAVTIVGALVIGEGAIRSGLASPATVVVVALAGVASFAVPLYSMTAGLRIVRFGLLAVSAVFGLFGLMVGMLFLFTHLAALRSFGRPYLQPIAPFTAKEILDSLIRAPHWLLQDRPAGNRPLNPRRKAKWLRPNPKQ